MTDATATTGEQGSTEGEAQGAAGTPAQGAASDTAQGAGEAQGTATVEAMASKIAALEKDNAAYRKRERDREAADRKRSEEGMSEVERLTAENERLKAQIAAGTARDRSRALASASLAAATALGYRNPSSATKLLRADDPEVKWNDEGEPTNVEALLRAFAEANPYAVTATDFGGGQRGGSAASGQPNMNDLIRGAAGAKR